MKKLSLVLVSLLSACAVGPDYEKPEFNMPVVWGNDDTQDTPQNMRVEGAWWTSFNDPLLTELVEATIASNPSYQQALSKILETRAQVKSITASLFPQIEGTGAYNRNLNSVNSSSDKGNFRVLRENNFYSLGLDTSWEIDLFGRIRRADEAAEATYDSEIATAQDTLVTLVAEMAQNYILLRQYQALLRATRENYDAWAEIDHLNTSLWQAGRISEVEVLQVQTSRDQVASQIPPLEANIKTTLHQIAILTGQAPTSLYEKLSLPASIPQISGKIFAELPSSLLQRRPDIRKAERDLASATAQIGVAVGDLFPKFSLTGNSGYTSINAKNFFDHGSFGASVGPTFTWLLLDFGKVRANIEAAEAVRDQNYYRYKSVILSALKDVENALVNLSSEGKRNGTLWTAFQASQGASDLSQSRYAAGLTDFLVVLNTKITRNNAELDFIQSQATLSINAVALYKALGGGWEIAEASDTSGENLLSSPPQGAW